MALPRGVRNRNPGNLIYNAGTAKYLGCTGDDGGGFCVFDTAQHGLRAMAENLLVYYFRKKLDTIRLIVAHWAPAAAGNDEQAYRKKVCGITTWGADDHLKTDSPSVLLWLMKGIITEENGQQPYTEAVLMEGITEALGAKQ